ncbi:TonB-dependent receptor [Alloacidobacterium sp.]|uniref:TonB-dependent receptor n=1 Tax=Alloacidobacterium sp. TaxID=2951999 RepID=UPI002D6644E5|nr:carboxypeptidase regulatory-like domain-containing protein [Alloacidobacterium sp.]HYK34391.1 carboxypeptidase regulatory-like domain-containing protein [Alloacidobacterium sp.]
MSKCFASLMAFCAVIGLLFTLVPNSRAQATTGLIVGRITDSTGAVIPDATVTATDEEKGVSFVGRSDSSGNYVILNVTPGTYTVAASRQGFSDAVLSHAVLSIDQRLLQNFRLTPGTVATTVQVTDKPSLLQTQTAEVGTVISGNDITDLPLLSRNFYDLTLLVPGVAQVGGSINSYALSVSGQREFANSILLDGVESTTNRTQDVTVRPSVDSVQEFKVVTSSYDAEYGDAAGGVVQIQTKAGTNAFHGTAYEFFRPNFLTARPYAFGGSTNPSPTLKQHNFGGTIGGPVFKDRSFFFVSYEGSRQNNAYTYLDSTIPFDLIKQQPDGSIDLSGLVDPNAGLPSSYCNGKPCPVAGSVDPIFDPATSYACYGGYPGCWPQQFSGNIIPANRVSAAGLNTLLNFYPKPNLPGTRNGWFSNFSVDSPVNVNTNQVDARYDQVITQADRLYAIYHWGGNNQLVTDPYHGATVVPGAGDADQANKQDDGAQSISITEDHIFSPTRLNEFRFGYTNYYQDQYSLLNGTDYSTKYGVGNITVPGYPATVGYPYMFLADGYLSGGSTYKPYHVLDQNYQFTDYFTLTGITGHTIKFGGDFRKLNSRPNFSLFPTGFQYYSSFSTAETSDPSFNAQNGYAPYVPNGWNAYGGSDIADLLLGLPEVVDIGLQLTNPHTQSWDLDLYAQDSWKITPSFTVNYGLRYEYQNPYTETSNYMSNYDVPSGHILVAGRGGNSDSLMNARKNQFAPRIGFAYQVDPKTVVRGGFGIFYSPENDGREDFLTKNAPFATQSSYFNSAYFGYYAYQLDPGVKRSTDVNIPANGIIDPANVPNGNLLTTYALDPHIRTGYSESFNVALQRQLGSSISVDLAYVGSLSHALSYQIGDINANPYDNTNNYDNRLTTDLGKIQYLTDSGFGDYNALELKVSKRASRNLSFLGSYTYSHNLDNGPAPFNLGHINNNNPQDPYNLRAEYASADSDVRHNFVFSGLWYLPIGQGQRYFSSWGPITNAILGGWQLNAIYLMQSGTPVNVVRGTDPTGVLPGLRPDRVGDPNLPRGKRTLDMYFNTAAFTNDPFIGNGSDNLAPGNAGRNIVVGPGNVNIDTSLFKEFPVYERAKLQLRMEAFNALNTPHFGNPDGTVSSGTYGEIIRQNGAPNANRVVQLDVKVLF